ncbi:conserved Plasmodium protein, unknown function [Plasmodium knowlesi strain H]|uniref:Uncharacterized protein n=3 Tax=Plasmodium knowlesi TaxID=5850 RepID=A0A5K1VC84_PLAKH|nr:conserved Plasmodium protein, unknown function [Plasmodium knowlesi strain H]OTN64280.1 Uncharacterized protein PKNOH_S140223200 [Plasmodium knowlesi]CAA9990660.1 conserved Plasmodium protein, unknown function [Plasmodium knowlesi strain H]SBO25969.1 conserved Plasmodium protein, unknown function [Plasmodium knowlesi strain H]SBO28698.1 conserved Plasmodium protein, unknown function [Plasmodium knowlesi strain H]VVS80134.1 conserved Plasmodium protein, unknown function [Plasmodium knowlesi |eukprot:XP_002261951.1 hypothetical protein, conserved in Plasmodium species [Plasmodium knowlesi strain H]
MKYQEKDEHERRHQNDDRDYGSMRKIFRNSYKKILWPLNLGIHDVEDKNLKKCLCLIVTNIPVDWTKLDITWFFREYFYKLAIDRNIEFPLIEQVYLIKNEPSAILACHDSVSRQTIENLSNCTLRSVKNKKKITLNIQPYYKEEVAEREKGKDKNREGKNESDNEGNRESNPEEKEDKNEDEEGNGEYTQGESEGTEEGRRKSEKEMPSDDEGKKINRMRKRSVTPPRKNGMEWPKDLELRNCSDIELRRKLCVFGRYKPLHWGVKELTTFLKYYFDTLKRDHEKFEIPEISYIWADKGTHLVTFACKNEKSRFNMLLVRACYLNEDDAKNNIKNALRVWIQFEKWTPYKNPPNGKYKNYKMPRSDFNKYSYQHDHNIDKGSYTRSYRNPPYDDYPKHRNGSYRYNGNGHRKITPPSNYYHNNADDRGRRNYDHGKNSYGNRSPSPPPPSHYNKYKKKYSRSPTPRNYYKKKLKRSRSHDTRKEEINSHGRKNKSKAYH